MDHLQLTDELSRRLRTPHGLSIHVPVGRSVVIDLAAVGLTGTTNPNHMRSDLEVFGFHLEPKDIECIEHLVAS